MYWFGLHPAIKVVLLAALLIGAMLVFAQVRSDYRRHRKLSRPVAWLQTGYFIIYALCAYVFVDSRLSRIDPGAWTTPASIVMMAAGVLILAFSMPILGGRSFGGHVGSLYTTGLYRYSRNPQLIGGFLLMGGYALLWPSLHGFLWAALWPVISHLMVRGEEAHLWEVFGEQYAAYCARTPRYLGWPRHRPQPPT